MILLFVLFLVFSVSNQWTCDFDYGQICLRGLPSTSFVLLNETNEQIRQPASDVTAILTSNDQGECIFPYEFGSFQMYFCEKTDPNLPATCPILNGNGSKMNCSEGQYGYEKFQAEESGSRSYQLESLPHLSIGDHCIHLFYYLSDGNSNGTIKVLLEDNQTNQNRTILIASMYQANKWHQIKQNFQTIHSTSQMFFIFERESSLNSNSFFIGIDEITILDILCESITTTATTTMEKSFTMITTNSIIRSTADSTMTDKSSNTFSMTSATVSTNASNSMTTSYSSRIPMTMIDTTNWTLSMNSSINMMTRHNSRKNLINSTMTSSTWSGSLLFLLIIIEIFYIFI